MKDSLNKYNVERFVPEELQQLLTKKSPEVFQIGNYNIWSIYNPSILFANSIIVEGEDGVIIIDTGISRKAGDYIKAKVTELSSKPIKTIIYSHHHFDHINGTEGLVSKDQVNKGEVQIIAASNFISEHTSENISVGPIMAQRASYGFGIHLEPEDADNFIIGGMMAKPSFSKTAHIKPTVFVNESLETELHGRLVHIFQTGGEAASEMVVYLPKEKILFCADEIYPSNPNLHSLRGTKPRDITKWIQAIDKMRTLEIDHLVGNHGYPVSGKEKIQEILIHYRDIIQYQHDQAIRFLNMGYTIEELQKQFDSLPEYLQYPPYSSNFYGHIKHNIPEFYVGYLSWFSGDPIELNPTPSKIKAQKMIELMGGEEKVLAEAKQAYDLKEYQFTAELATLLIKINRKNFDARNLKAACYKQLGYQQSNSWWRAWYLTSALELEGKLDLVEITERRQRTLRSIEFISALTIEQIYSRFRYSVNAQKAKDAHLLIGFHFTDTNQKFAFELRNSILEFHEEIPVKTDATLKMERTCLNSIMTKQETIPGAILKRKIKIEGKKMKLQQFFKYLDLDFTPINLTLR